MRGIRNESSLTDRRKRPARRETNPTRDTRRDGATDPNSDARHIDRQQRDRIASKGNTVFVPGTDDESAAYWLVPEDGEEFPAGSHTDCCKSFPDSADTGSAHTGTQLQQSVSWVDLPRVRQKTRQHTGSEDRATCPNCGTTTRWRGSDRNRQPEPRPSPRRADSTAMSDTFDRISTAGLSLCYYDSLIRGAEKSRFSAE